MKSTLNKHRLNNLLRGVQKSIDLFESQGHTDVYFTAQFSRAGKKQNGIERGELASFAKQIRTYVTSEEADSVRIDFFDNSNSKSIYSKVIDGLRSDESGTGTGQASADHANALGGFNGLGEAQVNALIERKVDRKVDEVRRNDDFQRMNREIDELRTKAATLESERDELEASLKAKKDIEFYSGIIGAAFPALAPLFSGTPLAQAAGFLSGTTDLKGNALPPKEVAGDDVSSISSLVSEFCATLNPQEAGAIHLMFMAFEADRSKIQSALHYITTASPIQAH